MTRNAAAFDLDLFRARPATPEEAVEAAEGQRRKTEVLEAHERRRCDLIVPLRAHLRELYLCRAADPRHPDACVTADDAVRWLKAHGHVDATVEVPRLLWLGAVFRGAGWVCTGFVPSVRAGNKGRAIRRWAWRPVVAHG